jgi:hypothetical protein
LAPALIIWTLTSFFFFFCKIDTIFLKFYILDFKELLGSCFEKYFLFYMTEPKNSGNCLNCFQRIIIENNALFVQLFSFLNFIFSFLIISNPKYLNTFFTFVPLDFILFFFKKRRKNTYSKALVNRVFFLFLTIEEQNYFLFFNSNVL